MTVVQPPSTNENVGNAGAGGSLTQLSALAWATSSISINNIQSSKLYPAITSGTQRAFSWFQSKNFRVINLRQAGYQSGRGYAAMSYPFISTTSPSPTENYSFRYDTYSYITISATATYPYVFQDWWLGTISAPTLSTGITANPFNITDYPTWAALDYFYIWAYFV